MSRWWSWKAGPSPAPGPDAWTRTRDLLREVRTIELQTSRLVDEHISGAYASAFKGSGMAFEQVRAYVPGDEVRRIDWNVTARTGVPHVKQFAEERQLTVLVIVDLSRSLDFGTASLDKRGLVARLAATFAFSAIRNGDRVGLVGVTDRVELFVPPRSGRRHVLGVVHRLLTHEPKGAGTRLSAGLEAIAQQRKSGSVVVVISDFADLEDHDPGFRRALELVRRRHDVIPVRVSDPLELALPALGLVELDDLEGHEPSHRGPFHLSARRARRYRERVAAERAALDGLLRRLQLDVLDVRADVAWQHELVHFVRRRAKRGRR